jgi:hypothetical protein
MLLDSPFDQAALLGGPLAQQGEQKFLLPVMVSFEEGQRWCSSWQ